MEGQREFLLNYIKHQSRVAFETHFSQCQDRIHAIFTFLAMLELVQQKFFSIMIGTGRNNFILEWNNNRDEDLAMAPLEPSS
jgi:segregation and condensation protein A